METTSRDSIAHKIKITSAETEPTVPGISDQLMVKVQHYLLSQKPKNKLERVQIIYSLADEIVADDNDFTVCRKGCAWCCAIPCEILPVEIEYIEKNTSFKRSKTNFELLPGTENNVGYCPLLDQDTGACTVYEYRPFNCRTFVAYDSPDYCKRGYEGEEIMHWVSGGPANGYGSGALLHLALDLVECDIGEKLSLICRDLVQSRVKDVRFYFE